MRRLYSGMKTWDCAFPSLERDLDTMLGNGFAGEGDGLLTFKYKTISRNVSGSFFNDGYKDY